MKCPFCKATLPDDSKFCNYCGEKLNIKAPEKESDTRPRDEKFDYVDHYVSSVKEEKEPGEEQKLWVILSIIAAGVLFAIIAVLVFYAMKRNQKTVVNPVTTTIQEETMTSQVTETETTVLETTIPEKTKAEETENTVIEETSEVIEETEEIVESEEIFEEPSEETVEETMPPVIEEREYGGMMYQLTEGSANLSKCYSTDSIVALGETVYDIPLISIGAAAFSGCTHITHVDLPDGLQVISDQAFSNCTSLVEVVIPPSVHTISPNAFEGSSVFTVIGQRGTLAESFASERGLPFMEGVTVSPFLN